MLRVLVAVVLVLTATGMATTGSEPVSIATSSPLTEQVGSAPPAAQIGSVPPAAQMGVSIADQEFDRTTFRINVSENGSARWTFVYRRDLSNQTERRQFNAFAEEFNEQSDLYENFKKRAQVLTESGAKETGREMNATGFSRRAYVGPLDNSGVVEMSFRWSNFAKIEGEKIIIGDVFEGGLLIGPNQRIAVTWSDTLTHEASVPKPDDKSDDTVTWTGKAGRQFYDNKPKVVLNRPTESESNAAAVQIPFGGLSIWHWLLGFGAFVLLTTLIAYRSDAITDRISVPSGEKSESGTESKPKPDDESTNSVITEAELMTDEDRVLSLLEENNGRMKQVNIVNETGWSKSKVSMLLSDMDDEDLISKLRVGRENIISIAGDEPEAARSPFEDDG